MTTGSLSQALTVPRTGAGGRPRTHAQPPTMYWLTVGGIRELYDAIVDDEELATKEVAEYRSVGGGTICDPTNIGLGRDHEALSRISQTTGVHLIMGSGWYRERVYPDYVHQEMPDQLADRLVDELVHGVDGSGIQPGFVGEIGTERGAITPAQERVFRAAGRAHQRTGVPIMTHTTHWGEIGHRAD